MTKSRSGQLCLVVLLLSCLFHLSVQLEAKCSPDQGIILEENIIDSPVRQILWVDDDAVEIYLVSQSNTLYKSNNEGKTWTVQNSLLPFVAEPQPLTQISGPSYIIPTADEKKVFIMGYGSILWSTVGDGKYNYYTTSDYIESIVPHPYSSDIALSSTLSSGCFDQNPSTLCFRALFITMNFGQSWKKLASYIHYYAWGDNNTVFYSGIIDGKGNQYYYSSASVGFYIGDNFGASFRPPLNYTDFLFKDGVLFTARYEGQGLSLWVCTDDSYDNFIQAQFDQGGGSPLQENRYTIIDASEAMTFINVQHDDYRYGNTYSAPNWDEVFSISLRNNKRNSYGTDFLKIQGLDGIYFANQYDVVDPGNPNINIDQYVHSLLTYDKGGNYSRLPVPSNVKCADSSCSLHLFGPSDYVRSPFYSVADAVGIVTGSGNVGEYRENGYANINVFFSSDAGENWVQIRDGSYIYEYGDHGGLIVFASNNQPTNSIVYTWNDGVSFYECAFSDKELNVENIRVEPSFTSRKFLLHGTYVFDNGTTAGTVILLDFTGVAIPQCQGASTPGQDGSDYELWQPGPDGCLLGQQVQYTRRKPNVECFNGEEYETKSVSSSCLCTVDDYICAPCFEKYLDPNGAETCVNICEGTDEDPTLVPEDCDDTYVVTQGYVLVPGDACDYLSHGAVNLLPLTKDCPKDDSSDYFMYFLVFVILAVALLLVAAAVAVVALYFKNDDFHAFISARIPFGKSKSDISYNLLNENGDPNSTGDNLADLLDDQYEYTGMSHSDD